MFKNKEYFAVVVVVIIVLIFMAYRGDKAQEAAKPVAASTMRSNLGVRGGNTPATRFRPVSAVGKQEGSLLAPDSADQDEMKFLYGNMEKEKSNYMSQGSMSKHILTKSDDTTYESKAQDSYKVRSPMRGRVSTFYSQVPPESVAIDVDEPSAIREMSSNYRPSVNDRGSFFVSKMVSRLDGNNKDDELREIITHGNNGHHYERLQ
jgi:hypothetical protein